MTAAKLGEWVVRWRWPCLVATLLFAAITGSGVTRLEFSNDYRAFFSDDNPELQAFEALQKTYTKNDNLLFVVAPKDGAVFSRATLETIAWLTEQAWKLPYSTRVDSVTNFQHTFARGDDLVVRPLVQDPKVLSDDELTRLRRVAVDEPLLRDRIISPDARVSGINVTIVYPQQKLTEVPEVMERARALLDAVRARDPNVDVYLTGLVPFGHAFAENALHDIVTLVPIMFVVVTLVAYLTLRSGLATLATLLVVALAIVTSMGLAGWLGIHITPPTASAPTAILTLAITDSVHVLLTFLEAARQGSGRHAAVRESLRLNTQTVFLTSLTTLIGFLTTNFSEAPPLRDLGNIIGMGVAAAWIYAMFLLPPLMAIVPMRVRRKALSPDRHMARLGDFVVRHWRTLLWTFGIGTIALLAGIPRNELDDQYLDYFSEAVTFRRDTEFAQKHLTGVYQIHYSLPANGDGGIHDPEYLKAVDAFARWLGEQPKVVHVNAITHVVKRLNQNLHGDAPAWYRVPDTRAQSAQYLLLYELSLPFGLDLNDQINVDKSATRLVVTLGRVSTKEMLALDDAAQQWLRGHAPASMQARGTGTSMMFAHISARNIESMIEGNLLEFALVSLILIFALRDTRLGLLSLVPNLVPAGMAFGLWGLCVGQVGLSLSVVSAITFGIVVDDTVHFMMRYNEARRRLGLSPPDAVRYVFTTVGYATWVASLVLMSGFGVLAFSAFWFNAGMGLLSVITIGFALLAEYFLLPPLLLALEAWREKSVGVVAVRAVRDEPLGRDA